MRFGGNVHGGRLHGTVVLAPKEEQDEQMEPVEATAEVQDRVDLTVKQIKSIVPKAKGSKKKDVQRSAMEVATVRAGQEAAQAPRVPRQREHAGCSFEHRPPVVCGSVSEWCVPDVSYCTILLALTLNIYID